MKIDREDINAVIECLTDNMDHILNCQDADPDGCEMSRDSSQDAPVKWLGGSDYTAEEIRYFKELANFVNRWFYE